MFLKNIKGIDKQLMAKNPITLDYLARKELGDLNPTEIFEEQELNERIICLKQSLSEEVCPSFNRLFYMNDNKKYAYAVVLKMSTTTASMTSLLPTPFARKLQPLLSNVPIDNEQFIFE